jgi:hypothetical protein
VPETRCGHLREWQTPAQRQPGGRPNQISLI